MKTKGHPTSEATRSRLLKQGREALERKGNFEKPVLQSTETSDPVYPHRGLLPLIRSLNRKKL